jgi:hypothetical protein
MKKLLLTILGLMTLATVHAQQTVVIERPGIFTDLASAATALVTLPVAAATGFVEGSVEAFRDVITGSTTVITAPAPAAVQPRVIVSSPVAVPGNQVTVTSPIVVGVPSTTVTTTVSSPIKVPGATIIPTPTTRITTDYGNGTTVTVTRPASAYELGPNVVIPVDPAHRVGSSPHVNPYVYRHR